MKEKLFIEVYPGDIVINALKDKDAPRIVIEPSKSGYICSIYSVEGKNAEEADEHASITKFSLWANEKGDLVLIDDNFTQNITQMEAMDV